MDFIHRQQMFGTGGIGMAPAEQGLPAGMVFEPLLEYTSMLNAQRDTSSRPYPLYPFLLAGYCGVGSQIKCP